MSDVDLDEILNELQRTIAERRRDGSYPEGMEHQLEAEFSHMLAAIHRDEIDTVRLGELIDSVGTSIHSIGADAGGGSRIPGGATVHGAAGRLVERHTGPLAESVRAFGSAVADALGETRRLVEAQRSADERQLLDAIGAVMDRLAVVDHLVEIARDLEERVAALESATADGP